MIKNEKLQIVEVDIDSIKPHPNNPHKIGDNDVAVVRNSIEQFGFIQPIAVWTDNVIRIGHTRWQAAKKLGLKKVPVVVLSRLSQSEADALLAIDNQTHAGFRWDYDKLSELIQGEPEMDWGKYFSADALASLLDEESDDDDQPVGEIDLPDEYKIIITCQDEREQTALYDELSRKGYDCFIPGNDKYAQ